MSMGKTANGALAALVVASAFVPSFVGAQSGEDNGTVIAKCPMVFRTKFGPEPYTEVLTLLPDGKLAVDAKPPVFFSLSHNVIKNGVYNGFETKCMDVVDIKEDYILYGTYCSSSGTPTASSKDLVSETKIDRHTGLRVTRTNVTGRHLTSETGKCSVEKL